MWRMIVALVRAQIRPSWVQVEMNFACSLAPTGKNGTPAKKLALSASELKHSRS
jgi:hypothetical protein